MIDLLTAIFCGAMIVVLPFLLLRAIEGLEEKSWIIAWTVMALFAWIASVWMVFLSPLAALLGAVIGAGVAWLTRSRPDFRV